MATTDFSDSSLFLAETPSRGVNYFCTFLPHASGHHHSVICLWIWLPSHWWNLAWFILLKVSYNVFWVHSCHHLFLVRSRHHVSEFRDGNPGYDRSLFGIRHLTVGPWVGRGREARNEEGRIPGANPWSNGEEQVGAVVLSLPHAVIH